MQRFFLAATVLVAASIDCAAADLTLDGAVGLLTVPTAETLADGTASLGGARYNPQPAVLGPSHVASLALGFFPALELGDNVVDTPGTLRDLSLNAKLRLLKFDGGAAIAVGGQDFGGQHQLFRSRYAVATATRAVFFDQLGHLGLC